MRYTLLTVGALLLLWGWQVSANKQPVLNRMLDYCHNSYPQTNDVNGEYACMADAFGEEKDARNQQILLFISGGLLAGGALLFPREKKQQ